MNSNKIISFDKKIIIEDDDDEEDAIQKFDSTTITVDDSTVDSTTVVDDFDISSDGSIDNPNPSYRSRKSLILTISYISASIICFIIGIIFFFIEHNYTVSTAMFSVSLICIIAFSVTCYITNCCNY